MIISSARTEQRSPLPPSAEHCSARQSRVLRSRARRSDERGLTESLQWALLTPLVMLVFLGIIQVGIWYHGHNVAGHAAAAAARAEAMHGAAAGSGVVAAQNIAANGGIDELAVDVQRSGTTVEVVVTGRAPMLIDLGLAQVRRAASAPLERQ